MGQNMQAIILAAGYAKRMRPLTNNTHKTLLEINGESVLSNIIIKLIKNDITDITLVVGYLAERLKEHVEKRFPEINFNYVENKRYDKTNNLVSLSMALEQVKLRSDVIIIESDLVYGDGVLKRILDSKYDNVALVDHYGPGMDGTVVSIEGEQITGVIPPHLQGSDFNFNDKFKTLNIYKFSSEFCFGPFKDLLAHYTTTIKDSYYELMLGVIIYLRAETIYAEILQGEKWAEIDDPNDLQLARYMFEDKPKEILDRSYGGFWNYDVVDYCYLRNMYFPPAAMLSELKNNFSKTIFEYGSTQAILNRKVSYFLESEEEHVVCVNGISQLFPILRNHFKGKSVLHPSPSFGDYFRVFPDANHYSDEVGINVEELEQAKEDVIIIVNPNNPTGSLVPTNWIYQYAESHPDKTVIVDESFIDFSDEPSLVPTLIQKALNNIIVVTSLSKVMGIAGLRLGYCYTHNQAFLETLKQEIPIWNINTIAENFLEILLKFRRQYQDSLELVKRDRTEFFNGLSSLSVIKKVYASGGDYLLAEMNLDEEQLEKMCDYFLVEHNTYLKTVSEKFKTGKTWMRFAVHNPIENKNLINRLNEYL
ncbi:MAG: aminotransferase class I/II-fold pyridoxal phosphate-dependent enzyme [Reichenbachiella sp.]